MVIISGVPIFRIFTVLAYMILRQKKVSFLQLSFPPGQEVLCRMINYLNVFVVLFDFMFYML